MDLFDRLHTAAAAIADRSGAVRHDVVVVLGSGFGHYTARLEQAVAIPYEEIDGFPLPTAAGHAAMAYSFGAGSNRVLLLSGRVHAYEGAAMEEVTFAVRTAILGGCRTVVLTNAAGGCGDEIVGGDVVLIRDHLNLAGYSPLAGPNDERLGPRWPDMTDLYTPALRNLAKEVGDDVGMSLREGVYAWFAGPMFETPAEVDMARRLGADLVGMSTVPEAIAARHMGAQVLGLSLVTNLAAGISPAPIRSEDVLAAGADAADRVGALLDALLHRL